MSAVQEHRLSSLVLAQARALGLALAPEPRDDPDRVCRELLRLDELVRDLRERMYESAADAAEIRVRLDEDDDLDDVDDNDPDGESRRTRLIDQAQSLSEERLRLAGC